MTNGSRPELTGPDRAFGVQAAIDPQQCESRRAAPDCSIEALKAGGRRRELGRLLYKIVSATAAPRLINADRLRSPDELRQGRPIAIYAPNPKTPNVQDCR